MRIIAGEWRGRTLVVPAGQGTRPMLDRVRESLFSILGDLVEDAHVLDLYAGSGSLGLEALSRGARHARFVERGSAALEALARNVEELGAKELARIVRGNALSRSSWSDEARSRARAATTRATEIASSAAAPGEHEPFDIVFFDPPYPLLDQPAERAKLFDVVDELVEHHLSPHGVVVFHLPQSSVGTLRFASGRRGELRTYGSSALCLVWKREAPHAGARPSA